MINYDTGRRLEVVPFRRQPEVIEMLKKFKKVETVTRDFSKAYKAAISKVLPDAKQIVDWFHILKNLTDDMLDYLKCKVRDKIKVLDLSVVSIQEKEILNRRERKKIEIGLKRWEAAREVHKLKESGRNNTEIAKVLQISRPIVIKYLGMTEPSIDSRPCKLDLYISRIKELLSGGYRYMEIFNQIKLEGYTSGISLYNSIMKGIRWEVNHKICYLKRSDIKKLLYTLLEAIQDGQPELKQLLELVSDFKALLSDSDENKLDEWIKKAEEIQIPQLDRFLRLIRSDKEAVKNAIRYQYSNGSVEGQNN